MVLKNPNAMQKMTIISYGDAERKKQLGTFTVQFNPTTVKTQHENVFQDAQGVNTSSRTANFSYSKSDIVTMQLIFDEGANCGSDLLPLSGTTVLEYIDQFLELCFHMDGNLHQPRYLKIQWGDGRLQKFDCCLQSANINYTSFAPSGTPLRAEVDVTFLQDIEVKKRLHMEGKNSPDVTHSRVVKAGDTLPTLCNDVYGSSRYYLRVAAYNRLNNFRTLEPGQEIIFPPLEA